MFRADRSTLSTRIVLQVIKEFKLNLNSLHSDSTTLSFSGNFYHKPKFKKKPAYITFTEKDWDFLEDIKQIRDLVDKDKFFFIVNAVDGVLDQSENEVVNYIREELETKAKIKNPAIFPVSSWLALYCKMSKNNNLKPDQEDNFRRRVKAYMGNGNFSLKDVYEASKFGLIERELDKFLTRDKGKYLLTQATERGENYINSIEQYLKLEQSSFDRDVSEIENTIKFELVPKINGIKEFEKKMKNIIGTRTKILFRPGEMKILEDALKLDISEMLDTDEDPEYIVDSIEKRIRNWVYNEEKYINEKGSEIANDIFIEVTNFAEKIKSDVFGSLAITLQKDVRIDFSPYFDIDVYNITDYQYEDGGREFTGEFAIGSALVAGIICALVPGGLGLLGGLFAGGLFGGATELVYSNKRELAKERNMQQVKKQMTEETMKNVKKLEKQLQTTVDKFTKSLTKFCIEYVDNEFNNVKNSLEKMKKLKLLKEDEQEKYKNEVNNKLVVLTRISGKFKKLAPMFEKI